MIQYSWLIPVLPALTYGVIILFTRRFRTLSGLLSVVTMAFCFALSVGIFMEYSKWDPATPLPSLSWTWLQIAPWNAQVGVLIDPLTINMLLVVTFISLLVQIYSWGYMHEDERFSTYYSYLSLFTASMLLLVVSNNYLQIFIGWELVGLCSYLLIGFWYFKPEAANAAVKAFWTTKLGDVGFLIGIVLLWRASGTFDLAELRGMVESNTLPLAGLSVITFCIYLGAAGKS